MAGPLPTHNPASPTSIESRITKHRYGSENALQYYEVFHPESTEEGNASQHGRHNEDKVWIVYIHGGAWRDPLITSNSFIHFLKCLYPSLPPDDPSPSPSPSASALSPIKATHHIAGIASLSYRLSPHPSHPQEPNTTPAYELRSAKHPDHVEDIVTGISSLQQQYGFGHRYVIVGHSCGATLGFQVAMCGVVPWKTPSPSWDTSANTELASDETADKEEEGEEEKILCQQPLAIVGVEGIYDIPLLVSDYADIPIYRTFTEGAFGSSSSGVWETASPALFGYGGFVRHWAKKLQQDKDKGKNKEVLAMIAHSPEDELVNMRQVEAMEKALSLGLQKSAGEQEQEQEPQRLGEDEGLIQYRFLELHGTHHEIWEKGGEMARCIEEAVRTLFGYPSG